MLNQVPWLPATDGCQATWGRNNVSRLFAHTLPQFLALSEYSEDSNQTASVWSLDLSSLLSLLSPSFIPPLLHTCAFATFRSGRVSSRLHMWRYWLVQNSPLPTMGCFVYFSHRLFPFCVPYSGTQSYERTFRLHYPAAEDSILSFQRLGSCFLFGFLSLKKKSTQLASWKQRKQ